MAWWLETGLGLLILAWACQSRFGCADLGVVVCRSRPGFAVCSLVEWWLSPEGRSEEEKRNEEREKKIKIK